MPTDKKQTGFRFTDEEWKILEALKTDTGLTATAVVVVALRDLAKRRGIGLVTRPTTTDGASGARRRPGREGGEEKS